MSDPKQTGPFEGEGSFVPHGDDHHPPQQIGRYRTEKLLGKGDFWVVYQAYDEYLDRSVAIKVPRLDRVSRPGEAEAYLDKARVLAMLNHPHIVPLHEVSITEDGLFFVVSKLITGNDLATIIQAFRLLPDESAEVVGSVAEALHYVHQRGLVHRDVKPGNILIDYSGTPYLTGFGLALKEEDYSQGGVVCGTPAYMSPEHANGEGHRVDGRSDIFSLGVVFYELLAGRRPFLGEGAEVLTQIIMDEPPPPREIECTIPRELERICLKALAKRASDRYTTAEDMADDLRNFVGPTLGNRPAVPAGIPTLSYLSTPEHPFPRAFIILSGQMAGRAYGLVKDRIVVGRNPDCDIPLNTLTVARYHARLVCSQQGYFIEDLRSHCGTYVNEKCIRGQVLLRDNDQVRIGDVILIYRTHDTLADCTRKG